MFSGSIVLILITGCAWLWFSSSQRAQSITTTLHDTINEHDIARRRRQSESLESDPSLMLGGGEEKGNEEDEGMTKPPSRALIDFVEEPSTPKDDQDEEANLLRPPPIKLGEQGWAGTDRVQTDPSLGGIRLTPPCLTVKYLMGLTTTSMERDWIFFDLLSALPNCSIR